MTFSSDHHGFYRDGEPFFPLVQESAPIADWSNVVLLRLPAQLICDLDWSKEMEKATQIINFGKMILWEIDLGLSQLTPDNSTAFFSYSLALEEFTAKVWPAFRNNTFGAALYRGALPTEEQFPRPHWETAFIEWSAELPDPCYTLYCVQMLSEYLHRLISFLPDSLLPFALIDATAIHSPAKIAQLFSKARFEHIQIALKGSPWMFPGLSWETGQGCQGYLGTIPPSVSAQPPSSLGIYLPNDTHIDSTWIQKFDQAISELTTPCRIIPEEKLTEQWDGLDKLLVDSQKISARGKRKLLGFMAAGGSVEGY